MPSHQSTSELPACNCSQKIRLTSLMSGLVLSDGHCRTNSAAAPFKELRRVVSPHASFYRHKALTACGGTKWNSGRRPALRCILKPRSVHLTKPRSVVTRSDCTDSWPPTKSAEGRQDGSPLPVFRFRNSTALAPRERAIIQTIGAYSSQESLTGVFCR